MFVSEWTRPTIRTEEGVRLGKDCAAYKVWCLSLGGHFTMCREEGVVHNGWRQAKCENRRIS